MLDVKKAIRTEKRNSREYFIFLCTYCGKKEISVTKYVLYEHLGRCLKCRSLKDKLCKIDSCSRKHRAKGYCNGHYVLFEYRQNIKTKKQINAANRKHYRTLKGRYTALKRSARLHECELTISIEEFEKYLKQRCFYCDSGLNETGHCLDRKDNNKGYTPDNVVPCCTICNRIKNKWLTFDEMRYVMSLLMEFRKTKCITGK